MHRYIERDKNSMNREIAQFIGIGYITYSGLLQSQRMWRVKKNPDQLSHIVGHLDQLYYLICHLDRLHKYQKKKRISQTFNELYQVGQFLVNQYKKSKIYTSSKLLTNCKKKRKKK